MLTLYQENWDSYKHNDKHYKDYCGDQTLVANAIRNPKTLSQENWDIYKHNDKHYNDYCGDQTLVANAIRNLKTLSRNNLERIKGRGPIPRAEEAK